MEILLVGTELGPWVSVTETADELFALAKAYKQLGHDVTLVVPYDSAYERGGLLVARKLSPLELADGHAVTIFDAQLASGAKVVLFGMPAGAETTLNSRTEVNAESLKAISVFARAVAAYVEQRAEQALSVDVVHLFDWPVAIAAGAIRSLCHVAQCKIVLSVHDTKHLGIFDCSLADANGEVLFGTEQVRLGNECCLMKAGLLAADTVIVPSDGTARSLESGPLSAVMPSLGASLITVGPGVDYAKVNPATNQSLLVRYDAEDHRSKVANKTGWLKKAGLSLDSRPLLLIPGPLTADNGAELLLAALEPLLEMDIALGVWETPGDDPAYSREFARKLSGRQGDASIVELTQDEQIHRGFAAADFVIYPSRDGHGLCNTLAAERYGAIVIACAQSSIGERVVNVDSGLLTGTGILFDEPTVDGLLGAVGRALSAYRSPAFEQLRRRVMRQDSSWDRPARRLLRLYDKARSGGASLLPKSSVA